MLREICLALKPVFDPLFFTEFGIKRHTMAGCQESSLKMVVLRLVENQGKGKVFYQVDGIMVPISSL